MTRGGKSRCGLCAVTAATVVLGLGVAAPAVASAPGVDEYELNLPNGGGNGSSTPEPPTTTTPTTAAAPVTPTVPTTQVAPTTTAPPPVVPSGPAKSHKPEHHRAVVLGSTSVNAKLGPEQTPSLKVRADDGGTPWLPITVAIAIAACCLIAVWRLRYLRELPAAPSSKPAASGT